jgi:hypothetical protein
MKILENHEAKATQEPQGSRTALSAHTPGPWRQHTRAAFRVIEERLGYTVATTGCDSDLQPQWEANARLIAAAPDLLFALQHAQEAIECMCPEFEALGLGGKRTLDLIAAAITKATEPPK